MSEVSLATFPKYNLLDENWVSIGERCFRWKEDFEARVRSFLKDAVEDKECMDSLKPAFYKGCGLAEESHHQEILILRDILGDSS